MAEIEKLAGVLKTFTDDAEILAEFYESEGKPEEARAIRRGKIQAIIARKDRADALRYQDEHDVLTVAELRQLACDYCQIIMEALPWEALEVARKYHLSNLEKKAAVQWSEEIIRKGHGAGPLLDIARKERADDLDYCQRAASYVFRQFIRGRHFSSLPDLLREFPSAFSEDEAKLAKGLAEMSRKHLEERNAQARSRAHTAS